MANIFYFNNIVLSPEIKLWETFGFSYCLLIAYKFIIVGVIKYKIILVVDITVVMYFSRTLPWQQVCEAALNPAVGRIMLTC